MTTTSEQQKRIRLELAASGLKFALQADRITRRSFFLPEDVPIQTNPAYSKEIANKNWQASFLERLVSKKIFSKGYDGRIITYQVVDHYEIRRILRDHENDGLLLSKHLFPSEVVLPTAIERIPEPVDSDTSAGMGEVLKTGQRLHIHEGEDTEKDTDRVFLRKNLDALGTVLTSLLDYMKGSTTESGEILNAISENLAHIRDEKFDEVGSRIRGVKDEFNSLKKRVDKMEVSSNQLTGVQGSLNHSIKQLIESSNHSGQAEEVATAVATALLPLANSVNELTAHLKASDTRSEALRQSTEMLANYMKNAEEDKMGHVLKMLKRHIEDGQTISDMLLDAKK